MHDAGCTGDKLGFSPSLFQPGLCSQAGGRLVCVKGRHSNEILSKTVISLGKGLAPGSGLPVYCLWDHGNRAERMDGN